MPGLYCVFLLIIAFSHPTFLLPVAGTPGTAASNSLFSEAASEARAHEWYVSPTGDDGDAGTRRRPFATWNRALAASRAAAGPSSKAIINFRQGTYVLNETVMITPSDSGTTFRSAPFEHATFRSCCAVKGWRPTTATDAGFASLPEFAQPHVFVAPLLTPRPRFLADETAAMSTRAVRVVHDVNSVYGLAGAGLANSSRVWYVGQKDSFEDCRTAALVDPPTEVLAFSWHDPSVFGPPWASGCYARTDFAMGDRSSFVEQPGVVTGVPAPAHGGLRQAELDITAMVQTKHVGDAPDNELFAPAAAKKTVRLGAASLADVVGPAQPAASLDLRVVESDYNMGILPIVSSSTATATSKYPSVSETVDLHSGAPGAFRLGRLDSIPYIAPESSNHSHALLNALRGLNAPGTWAAVDGLLYYWPAAEGATALSLQGKVWAPMLTQLVLVQGGETTGVGAPVENLTFSNLTFTGGDRYAWGGNNNSSGSSAGSSTTSSSNAGGDQGGIQHDYAVLDGPTALLRMRVTAQVLVDGCAFENSGGSGVRFDLLAQNNTVQGCSFAELGLEAFGIYGYGAGTKDASTGNVLVDSEISRIGRVKWDAPAVVLWHTAFNEVRGCYVHDISSKAIFIGGMRSIAMDPTPFNGTITIHEAGWRMARWDEIGSDAVEITGTEIAPVFTPPNIPGDEFAADAKVSKYRYTRGNTIVANLFANCHIGTDRASFFGDGTIYLSGVGDTSSAPNTIADNVFVRNPGPVSEALYESIYADGFGGAVAIVRNAIIGSQLGGFQLCTWWGKSPVVANVASDVGDVLAINYNCDGNTVVLPSGNLHLDVPDDPLHDPVKSRAATDYTTVFRNVCDMAVPGSTPLSRMPEVSVFLAQLAQEIAKLGAARPRCG